MYPLRGSFVLWTIIGQEENYESLTETIILAFYYQLMNHDSLAFLRKFIRICWGKHGERYS